MTATAARGPHRPQPPARTGGSTLPVARGGRVWLVLLGCFAIAALSLLTPSLPTYDPWAWIIWGREVAHADLATATGPSWKPLPVVFTTLFSLVGDDAAPALWLVVARAGGVLAFAMAYRLAARLAGPVAGVIAAGSLVLCAEFIRNFDRGNSEGILVALCLWALERHLDGHRRSAFVLGLGAALLRPEVWPFIAVYGLWLLWGERTLRTLVLVLGGGAMLLVLWFLPEYLGSGDLWRAAARAREPNPSSAAFAAVPFLEVFARSAGVLNGWTYAGGLVGVAIAARAWRTKRLGYVPLLLAVVSTVLMLAVAAMTQAGFAGNLRYVALPAALVCVLAGAGWVWLVRAAGERFGRWARVAAVVLVAAAALPFLKADVDSLRGSFAEIRKEYDLYAAIPVIVERAGGAAKLRSCGTVYTGNFQTQALAWELHLHQYQVRIFPFAPGTVVAPAYTALSRDPRFTRFAAADKWVAASSCAAEGGG